MSTGKVVQVIGPVVDVEFPPGQLPNIYNALKVTQEENKAAGKPAVKITLEVATHLGENRVRGIAMSTTDGLTRGMDVHDTGAPISVPVGRETLYVWSTHGANRAPDIAGQRSRYGNETLPQRFDIPQQPLFNF